MAAELQLRVIICLYKVLNFTFLIVMTDFLIQEKHHILFGLTNTDKDVYIHLCLIFYLCLLYRATEASILDKFVSISTDRKAQRGLAFLEVINMFERCRHIFGQLN